MKKIFLRTIAIVLILTMSLPMFANAATISTEQANGITEMESVEIKITTDNPVNIMQFDLEFDSSRFDFTRVDCNLEHTVANVVNENIVRVSAFDLQRKTDKLKLYFTSKKNSVGTDISFNIKNVVELGEEGSAETFDNTSIKIAKIKAAPTNNNTTNNNTTNGNTTNNNTTNGNTTNNNTTNGNTTNNNTTNGNTTNNNTTNGNTTNNNTTNGNTTNNNTTNGNTTNNNTTNNNITNNNIINNNITNINNTQNNNYNQYITEEGKVIKSLPQTGTSRSADITSIGVYTRLISDKIVVPYVLPNSDATITKEDIKKEFGNDIVINETNPIVKTGDTFTLNNIDYTVIIYGDYNKDGKVTTRDALEIGKYTLNPQSIEKESFIASDVVMDKDIKEDDFKKVQQFIIGNGKIIDKNPAKIVGVTTNDGNFTGESEKEMSITLYTKNTSKAQKESSGLLYTIIPIKLIDEKGNVSRLKFGDINVRNKKDAYGKVSVIEIGNNKSSYDISVIGYISDGQGGYNEESSVTSEAIDAIGIAIDTNSDGYDIEKIKEGITLKYDGIDENGKICRKETKVNVTIDTSEPEVGQTFKTHTIDIENTTNSDDTSSNSDTDTTTDSTKTVNSLDATTNSINSINSLDTINNNTNSISNIDTETNNINSNNNTKTTTTNKTTNINSTVNSNISTNSSNNVNTSNSTNINTSSNIIKSNNN